MRTFDLYERAGQIEAVKQGFSWPAFVFSWIWAFAKGMPWLGAAVVGLDLAFVWAEKRVADGSLLADSLGAAYCVRLLVVGALANAWRRLSLAGQGFSHVDTIPAYTRRAAVETWLGESAGPP
ncbi:MAG: hypothetical protein ACREI8_13430 [Myxococcota bacterium]